MMSFFQMSSPLVARRLFLGRTGLTLSGAAVALLAGNEALAAQAGGAAAQDVQILNTALGAELEAIAAYQLGAESKLLQPGVLDLALSFQGHHKEHADLLAKTVVKLGGKAVQAKARYNFPVEQLKSQGDVLKFAASLEQGAVSAYLGAVPRSGQGSFHREVRGRAPVRQQGAQQIEWREAQKWLDDRLLNLNDSSGADRFVQPVPGGQIDVSLRWRFERL
jgi:hypothetical protein